ncbi:MAG: cytochrome b5 domain-containing protein [Bacillota bacterium]|nr:cytochrome b5 domain-containing protein [Bacillota bacterium]
MHFKTYECLEYHILRLNNYQNLSFTCCNTNQKILYSQLILLELNKITNILYYTFLQSNLNLRQPESIPSTAPQIREFTLDELSKFNGSGGTPAYAAINGVVYDVSLSPAWGGGSHFGLLAGKDLTHEFAGCHKSMDILNSLPRVGILEP